MRMLGDHYDVLRYDNYVMVKISIFSYSKNSNN